MVRKVPTMKVRIRKRDIHIFSRSPRDLRYSTDTSMECLLWYANEKRYQKTTQSGLTHKDS